MLSYILLLCFFLLITSIVYIQSEKVIETEINNLNESVLTQIQIAIDSELTNVKKTAYQVGLNKNLRVLVNENFSLEDMDRYKIFELEKELSDIRLRIDYALEFFIYLKNIDMILASGLISPKDFFQSTAYGVTNFNDMEFTQWHQMLQNEHNEEFIVICYAYEGHDIRQRVLYTQSIPLSNTGLVSANIVITLNKKIFEKILQTIHTVNNGHALILDSQNRVMLSTNDMYDGVPPVAYEKLTGKTGWFHTRLGGDDMVVSYINSNISDWKYVSIVPSGAFWENLNYIRTISTAAAVLCILLGGVAAYFFTRRNYSPITRLIQLLEKKAEIHTPSLKKQNEYHFLQDTMANILHENEAIKQSLMLQNVALRSIFLTKLLKGTGIEDREFTKKTLASYGLQFVSDAFAVMLFYIVDFKDFLDDGDTQSPQDTIKLVQFVITNIAEEMIGRENIGYMTEVDGMLACIVNFRNLPAGEGVPFMLKTAQDAAEFIWNNFKINFTVSVSSVHETLYGIPPAYHEALSVMEYKVATEDKKILCYDEIHVSRKNFNYSITTELQLINCIKAGDYKAGEDIINHVFNENFSNTSMSISLIKCLIFDLASTIVKTVSEISVIYESPFMQELTLIEKLSQGVKVQEMRQEILEILKKVCHCVQQNKRSRTDDVVGHVTRIVNENYSDFNLTVARIAENIKLSPTHLTKVFKEQTGEGLFDYISRIRMENAKHLLKDQKINIKDVALNVGYYNSSVFIRAFKKYEGVTPGMFRGIE